MNIKLKTHLPAAPSYQLPARYVDGVRKPKSLKSDYNYYEEFRELKMQQFEAPRNLLDRIKDKFKKD